MSNWLNQNWFVLLQSFGIIAGLLFTAMSLRIDARVLRISNMIKMAEQHRNLWSQLISQPELSRVIDQKADLQREPITEKERWFAYLIILHLYTAYRAMKDRMFMKPEGLQKDIQWIFSLPITKAVWETLMPFQDKDFVKYIEDSRNGK